MTQFTKQLVCWLTLLAGCIAPEDPRPLLPQFLQLPQTVGGTSGLRGE